MSCSSTPSSSIGTDFSSGMLAVIPDEAAADTPPTVDEPRSEDVLAIVEIKKEGQQVEVRGVFQYFPPKFSTLTL